MNPNERNSTTRTRLEAFVRKNPPSLNAYLRMHWRERKKLGVEFGWEIRAAVGCGRPRVQFRKIEIERRSINEVDLDNLWGGMKGFIDALRHLDLIPEDKPSEVDISVRQARVKTKEEEGTLLILEKGEW